MKTRKILKEASRLGHFSFMILAVCFAAVFLCHGKPVSVLAAEGNQGVLHAFYPANAVFSEQMKKYIDDVDTLSFAWSRMDAEAPELVNTQKGLNDNWGFYYPTDFHKPVEYAAGKGKRIQLNIYMDGSDCTKVLPYAEQRSIMIQAIVKHLQAEILPGKAIYYDGVVIDFEGLRDTSSDKKVLEYEGKRISYYFIQFLTELKQQMADAGKSLYVAVNPGLYYDGYNYASILGIADRVILMAHDYEPTGKLEKGQVLQYTGYNALEPISSMAPIGAVRQALNELQSAAASSSDLSRVWLQLVFDSAQWQFEVTGEQGFHTLDNAALSHGGRLTPLYQSIKARVDNTDGKGKNITYGYNNELQTPYLQYYNSSDRFWNIILYEDSNSIRAKIELAKTYGLGGISLWSLGNVPDYTDASGKKYHLDVWTAIQEQMSDYAGQSKKKYITIADAGVEQAVRNKLGKAAGKLTAAELQSIFRLKLPQGVKNLKDLKNLPNLEYLDAQQLGIKSIAGLESLTKLRVLYLQRNSISDISPLKKMKKLEVLSLNGNGLADISPLASLTGLKELYLRENKITDITPVGKLAKLEVLELGGNSIKKTDAVKKLKSLRLLALDNNKITDIKSLAGLTGLNSLYLQRNTISDITPLSALSNLKLLSLNGNKISSLKPLGKLTGLEKLYLKDNKITSVTELKNLKNLKELYLSGNSITNYSPVRGLQKSSDFNSDF